jgi:hypothetical protein
MNTHIKSRIFLAASNHAFLATLMAISFCAIVQAQSKTDLIGTWRLVSGVDTNEKGETSDAYGKEPSGFLTYTAEGRMMAIISFGGRRPLSVSDYTSAPAPERAEAYATFLAYAGTFSLDTKKVIHHVEVASIQNYVNTDLVRTIVSLQNGRLVLRTSPFLRGGRMVTREIVWDRLN